MPADGPNVLFVIDDQHQANALGVADSSYHTPNIDALADDGTRFTRCYTSHPQCSPARSSMVTGLFPHQTGVHALSNGPPDDRYVLDPASHSVGRVFQDAGYETAWFGRWHLGEDNVEPLGWETASIVPGVRNGQEGRYHDERILSETLDFLRDDHEKPFFLTASFNLPHRPYFDDEGFADAYDPDEVPIPENFDDNLADKPALQRAFAPGDVPDQYRDLDRLTESQFRDVGYRYRTMVSRLDSYVGQIRDTLDETELAEDTVVVFVSDHGDMQGGHGLVGKHTLAYEEELRVPLVVAHPNRDWRPLVDDLVSMTSLPGTLIELAGLDVPPAFEGGSLVEVLEGGRSEGRVFFEHNSATGEFHPYRGVRTERWKYVEYVADEAAELYDLDTDPLELENLAADPDHADTRERLASAVIDWWTETGGDETTWFEPVPN